MSRTWSAKAGIEYFRTRSGMSYLKSVTGAIIAILIIRSFFSLINLFRHFNGELLNAPPITFQFLWFTGFVYLMFRFFMRKLQGTAGGLVLVFLMMIAINVFGHFFWSDLDKYRIQSANYVGVTIESNSSYYDPYSEEENWAVYAKELFNNTNASLEYNIENLKSDVREVWSVPNEDICDKREYFFTWQAGVGEGYHPNRSLTQNIFPARNVGDYFLAFLTVGPATIMEEIIRLADLRYLIIFLLLEVWIGFSRRTDWWSQRSRIR